jgi:gas vesicle protein
MQRLLNFVAGFFLGSLIGAGVGLMLAPRSGTETQEEIRERVTLVMEEGRRAAAERRAELEAQFAEARRTPHSY